MANIDQKRSPFERYKEYVLQLEKAGKKFPTNQFGEINYTKIAGECGNRRQWFSESAKRIYCPHGDTLEQVIAKDIRRIGTEFIVPRDPDSSLLVDIPDSSRREANRLLSMLEQKSKENEILREQVERLATEIRQLRSSNAEISGKQELMIDSGRSFTL